MFYACFVIGVKEGQASCRTSEALVFSLENEKKERKAVLLGCFWLECPVNLKIGNDSLVVWEIVFPEGPKCQSTVSLDTKDMASLNLLEVNSLVIEASG